MVNYRLKTVNFGEKRFLTGQLWRKGVFKRVGVFDATDDTYNTGDTKVFPHLEHERITLALGDVFFQIIRGVHQNSTTHTSFNLACHVDSKSVIRFALASLDQKLESKDRFLGFCQL